MISESISRFEDAARTQDEFEVVIEWWMVSNIRKDMYEVLKKRQTEGISMTVKQRAFMNTIDEEKAKAEKEEEVKKTEKPTKAIKRTNGDK
jgi:hypothetical protein